MAGQPWMKLWVADLQSDPGWRRCRAEGKALWIQALCEMHVLDSYEIVGSYEDLSLALSLPVTQVRDGVKQLEIHKVADVKIVSGFVQLISRRRLREFQAREKDRLRKREERLQATGEDEDDAVSTDSPIPVLNTHARARADSDSCIRKDIDKQEVKSASRGARFKAPTEEEVRSYAMENALDDHAHDFINHYEAVGWRVGSGSGKPMKSWTHAYRNWCRRAPQFKPDGKATGKLSARQYAGLSLEEAARRAGLK